MEDYFFETGEEKTSDKVYALIVYDIVDNRQRVKLANFLQGYGFRVQKSAFEAYITKSKFQKMLNSIEDYVTKDDSIRIYKIIGKGQVITFGKEVDMQGITDTAKYIKLEGNKYSQMKVIDGFQLVPHLKEYFLEDSIHPNILGMITYADNLVKAIEKISF